MDGGTKAEPSVGELLKNLTRDTGVLVRQEVELAGAEIAAKARTTARDLGLVAAGGALAQAGLIVLLAAVVVVISAYMPLWASALVIGGAALLGGMAITMSALAALKRLDLTPKQTIHTLHEDKAMLKEQFR